MLCEVISSNIDSDLEFYAICKLIDVLPEQFISPSIKNAGFVSLRRNFNKSDWIGNELKKFIKKQIAETDGKTYEMQIVCNMLQFVECTESYLQIIDIVFELSLYCMLFYER